LENLIDIHAPMTKPQGRAARREARERAADTPKATARLRAKSYMQSFINPPEFLSSQGREESRRARQARRFPSSPERDLMRFLLEHAPLAPWQSAVLEMIREEALYFAPQAQTKIMNEGWASYWHSTLCTTGDVMGDAEIIDYAEKHAGITATSGGRLNPYKLGIELFRDIEERWDMGRFGQEYESCDSFEERRHWDRQLGLGREKVFEVRRLYNDVTFIHEFLTADFCRRHHLFSFSFNSSAEQYEIESREFSKIKQRLLFALTNSGNPVIDVVDANHKNRGELFLQHRYEGTELDMGKARATIANLQKIWGRPVHLASRDEKHSFVLSHDGSEVELKEL
jgi:stage V sporulation protein R